MAFEKTQGFLKELTSGGSQHQRRDPSGSRGGSTNSSTQRGPQSSHNRSGIATPVPGTPKWGKLSYYGQDPAGWNIWARKGTYAGSRLHSKNWSQLPGGGLMWTNPTSWSSRFEH